MLTLDSEGRLRALDVGPPSSSPPGASRAHPTGRPSSGPRASNLRSSGPSSPAGIPLLRRRARCLGRAAPGATWSDDARRGGGLPGPAGLVSVDRAMVAARATSRFSRLRSQAGRFHLGADPAEAPLRRGLARPSEPEGRQGRPAGSEAAGRGRHGLRSGVWLFDAHHVPSEGEFLVFTNGFATAPLSASSPGWSTWRRAVRSPQLAAHVDLLDALDGRRLRDPLVGRDLLVGAVAAAAGLALFQGPLLRIVTGLARGGAAPPAPQSPFYAASLPYAITGARSGQPVASGSCGRWAVVFFLAFVRRWLRRWSGSRR